MQKNYYITFKENKEQLFDVELVNNDTDCLTKYFVFPAKFVFNSGEELIVWLNNTYSVDYRNKVVVHELQSSTIWFELYVKPNGNMQGKMQEKSNHVKIWMNNSFYTYYYDRFGERHYVTVLDEEGDDIKGSPGTCNVCHYKFLLTNEFVDGRCSACDHYKQGVLKKPDLNSDEWKWILPEESEVNSDSIYFNNGKINQKRVQLDVGINNDSCKKSDNIKINDINEEDYNDINEEDLPF